MTLIPRTRFGPYEILALIGTGGMGEVYRARDTRLDRIVAIKILPARTVDRPELRERFEREARVVSSLNHPHICTLHDVGSQDGVDYFVMEYCFLQTCGGLRTPRMNRVGSTSTSLRFRDPDDGCVFRRRAAAGRGGE